jgi:hypothetical protein
MWKGHQLVEPGVGHLGAGEAQHLEVLASGNVFQSGVRDVTETEVQEPKLRGAQKVARAPRR